MYINIQDLFLCTIIILCVNLEIDYVADGSCQVGFIYGLGQRPVDGVEGAYQGTNLAVEPGEGGSVVLA